MAKFKMGNIGNRVVGAAAGAGMSAIVDYAMDSLLPDYVSYGDYAKIGVGLLLPAVVKQPAVTAGSDAMMSIGLYNVLSDIMLGIGSGDTGDKTGEGTTGLRLPGASAIGKVNHGFPAYKRAIRKNKVSGTPGASAISKIID